MSGVLAVRAFITNDSDTLHLMTATFLIYWQLDSIKEDIVDEIKKGVDKHESAGYGDKSRKRQKFLICRNILLDS